MSYLVASDKKPGSQPDGCLSPGANFAHNKEKNCVSSAAAESGSEVLILEIATLVGRYLKGDHGTLLCHDKSGVLVIHYALARHLPWACAGPDPRLTM